jgi:ParB family transcriptional regulator, chromosome partitioning protein
MGEGLMARKNLLSGLMEAKLPAGNSDRIPVEEASPVAQASIVRQGAIGAVSRSIAELKQQVNEAESLKQKLAEGQAVVELDPALVHPAFVSDRLGVTGEEETALLDSIRASGQQVPILVRPHPDRKGEYQIAYGHRRFRCARALGIGIRAVVRTLSDAELVVAQGTENSARADLSFIERAVFAHKLEAAGFERDVIMSALAIDKTALSKLIAVSTRVPARLIEAIGPAPKTGRDRWLELAALWAERSDSKALETLAASSKFIAADSDQRFELAMRALAASQVKSTAQRKARRLLDEDGRVLGKLEEKPKALLITLNAKAGSGFADFVHQRLPSLIKEFRGSG